MGCTNSLNGILTIWHNNPLGIEKMPVSDSELIRLNLFPVPVKFGEATKTVRRKGKNIFHADSRSLKAKIGAEDFLWL
jgi:hypothetical protein